MSRTVTRRVVMGTAMVAASWLAADARVPADEPAPHFKASALVSKSILKGPHYTIDEAVVTEGYYHQFAIASDYGPFTALGRTVLTTRLNEIRAIAALNDVSKSEVFLKSAGGAVVDLGKGVANVVTKPTETAKGIGGGIKRFGVNLGRASKRAMTTEGGASTGDSAPEGAANTLLGVSSAMRKWAQKVGADPYTTNITLRNALKGIADVDVAGSIVTKVVVPVPMVVGTAADVGDLVWSKDPEELRKLNESRAKTLGASESVAGKYFKNGWFTLTMQTRLISALHAVNRPGCADYLQTATHADDEREALFYVESAELLQQQHAKTPVTRVLDDSQALVALAGSKAVLLAPLDYVRSTDSAREVLTEVAGRARGELKATALELRVTGKVSADAAKAAKGAGWTVVENAPRK